jgi:hypothetical protein
MEYNMYKVTIFFYDSPPIEKFSEWDIESLEWIAAEWQSNDDSIHHISIEECNLNNP